MPENPKLKVFLCHSKDDKPNVRELYHHLVDDGFDAWLDEEKLMPGQDWDLEIRKAVRESDVVIVCLSNSSITKAGYVQKEIGFALDVADEQPEGGVFIIPARLEECQASIRLSKWQWVNLFEENGYKKLINSLDLRADKLGRSRILPSNEQTILRYGFDKGIMGWQPRIYPSGQAVVNLKQSPAPNKLGQSSLEILVDLKGQDEKKSRGELFVNLSANPPAGVTAPLNLEGKLITMLVFIPSQAIGHPHNPNGFQVFVEDVNGMSQYGQWTNLTLDNTDQWITIGLQPSSPSKTNLRKIPTSTGFDPSKITIIGLKIGAGSMFMGVFRGSFWIAGVYWP